METIATHDRRSLFFELLKKIRLTPDKKLTILDGRAIKLSPYTSSVYSHDVVHQFFTNISLRDHHACEKLAIVEKDRKNGGESHFGSADILFAILSQSDPLLLQDLLRKMIICNAAVPVMLPDVCGTDLTLLLWGLRKCSVSHYVKDTTENVKINCLQHPFLTITFLHIGKTTTSKSDILNKTCAALVGVSNREHFRPFLEENSQNTLGNGIVECFWLVDTCDENNKNIGIPVCVRNVRGDAYEHTRQLEFCSLTSSILIIFAELESKWKELKEILTNSRASHFLILSSSTDFEIQIPPGKKVRKVSTSELNISEILLRSVSAVMNKCIISKPLAEEKNLCKTLKISIDEEASFCLTAKLIATEIATKIKEAKTERSKDTVFPLLMMDKEWVISRCTGRADQVDDEYFEFFQAEKTLRENQRKLELSEPTLRIIHTILEDEIIGLWLLLWLEMSFQCYTELTAKAEITSRVVAKVGNTLQRQTNAVNRDMFLGELQQVVQCSKSVSKPTDPTKSFQSHSRIFAKLLLHGHSLHIADCDSKFVPTTWIRRLFADLHEMTGESGIRVVSILGAYKSGKSKLLNRLFGVDFPEGYGKLSAGLQLHLVPTKSCTTTAVPSEYCLLIDTEGLNIEEKSVNLYETRWLFISMIVISLSDAIIIQMCSKQSFSDMNEIVRMVSRSSKETEENGRVRKICFVYQTDSVQTEEIGEIANEEQEQSEKAELFKNANFKHEETVKFVLWDDLSTLNISNFGETINSLTTHKGIALSGFRKRIIKLIASCEEPVFLFNEFGEKVVDLLNTFQKRRFNNIHSPMANKIPRLGELHKLWNKIQVKVEKHVNQACKHIQHAPYDKLGETIEETLNDLTNLDKRNMLMIETFKHQLQKSHGNMFYKESLFANIEDLKSVNKSRITTFRHKMVKVKKIRREKRLLTLRQSRVPQYEDHDTLIETEINSFLRDNDNEQSERNFLRKWSRFIETTRKKYPVIELKEQQKVTQHQVMSLLEESGYDLQDIAPNKSFQDVARSAYHISTEEDLFKVRDNFHTATDTNEKLMQNLFLELEALCKMKKSFSVRTEAAVELFRRFDEESDLPVDRVTLFTFLCSQYISKVHITDLEEESRSTEINTAITDVNLDSDHQGKTSTADQKQYPNLNSKIENVLLRVKTFLTDEEISVLKQSLNEQTVQNYTHLPFNCTTLQRLDIYFHNLLPTLSKYDMEYINSVVDDAKMFILGKVLAKANLDLSQELNTIFASIERDLKTRFENTAVVFHLSRWSIPLVSIKLKRDKEEQSLLRSIERLGNITLAKFLCNINVASDVLLADILCEEIQHSLLRFIEDSWVDYFTEQIFTLEGTYKWKEKVILHMLCDFCERNDFENFIDCVQNFKHIGKRKFIKLVANIFNETKDSHIHTFAENIIRTKITECLSALEETTELFQSQEGCSMEVWLHKFVEKMSRYSIHFLRQKHLEILKKCTKVSNLTTFTKQCERKVLNLNSKVLSMLHLPPAGNTDYTVMWFYEMPSETHIKLIRGIKGCTSQCPLCGATCKYGLPNHTFHRATLHYPMCFTGSKYKTLEGTWKLNINTCSQDDSMDEYSDKLKEWEIPEKNVELIQFWKYMLHTFSSQLQHFHNCFCIDISPEWYKISQSEALKSLNDEVGVTSDSDLN